MTWGPLLGVRGWDYIYQNGNLNVEKIENDDYREDGRCYPRFF
jgi:hypothetical protein